MAIQVDPLRSAGLRRTPARRAVLACVASLDRPVTHAELQSMEPLRGIDAITLYRTLSALESAGLLHRVHGIDGVWRYRANPPVGAGCPGNHVHFLCATCGAMSCLADQPMPRVEVPPGARVDGRHFLVFGQCAGCVAQEATG